MTNCFTFPEESDVTDLIRYLERAKKLDNSGAVRFRAYGEVLTVYVAPIATEEMLEHTPLILGLRTMQLETPAEFDASFNITSVLALLKGEETEENFSLIRKLNNQERKLAANQICLPEAQVAVPWSTETPTRTGWEQQGELSQEELAEIARKGVAQVAETLPASVGGPIAARVRAEIWGRAFDYKNPIPMGAAFVAAGLGFLTEGEQVPWYVSGDWIRLSAKHGHVLSRFAIDYVAMNN